MSRCSRFLAPQSSKSLKNNHSIHSGAIKFLFVKSFRVMMGGSIASEYPVHTPPSQKRKKTVYAVDAR